MRPGATDGERLVTAGLVGLAAVWVFLGYTRAPQPRKAHQLRMIVYFIGLLVIASALASREYIFFLFMITGFFHASVLRPWPVVFAGVFATSVLVNTVIGGFPTNPEWWTIYVAIIAIQTLVIGGGVLLSERMAEQSEQRRLTVTRLEAALEENAGLHAQLLTQAREAGVLDERQRMAREIHDTIAQGLTGIVTQLEAAQQASERPDDRERHVRNAIGLARDSLSEARRSVEGLRPEHLETARLPDALAEVARAWSELQRRARRGGHHGRRPAASCRSRGGAVADGTGGAGQRREARKCVAGLADAVLHGRRRDARRAGRRRRVHGVRRSRHARRRLRAVGDAPAGQSRGRNAGDRIRARRRNGDLGTRAGDRGARPGRQVMTRPIRLLIVDDHPVVRDGLRGMFSGDPEFDVVGEAADGGEAIELASRLDPDVILMDLRMPGVNGATAIRTLAERQITSRVLVLTTYDSDSDVVPAIEAGATGYLLKDSPREELFRAVRAASRGESVLASSVATRLMSQLRDPAPDALSDRELEVLSLIAQGETNRGAAARLFISEATVKTHLLHIYAKLNVNDRAAAVATAFERGLLRTNRDS